MDRQTIQQMRGVVERPENFDGDILLLALSWFTGRPGEPSMNTS
jgi:hypothetical protein